ncbi:hypothetical protein GGR21_000074 [Dysgonomonas hofstadii]|uniref:RagB/SusD family nutrient uptake outer membrane protein n=1 Tax=Dysgonomonas hofstadii TaxID=637886 RepID=A0A840CHR3_9BACT|nr:RagB/SusD family nutrient uptake outer membrane protein [Dysgonomonas hofstadii]MBB4034189.1 hypothetical protein [Dysgonomonas hofstadii]
MKTIKYIFLSFLSVCLFSSCSDFLDKEPTKSTPETYFNTESELKTFLLSVYNPLMQEYFYGDCYPLYIAGGDDLTFYQRSSPKESMICATASPGTPEITSYWRILYDGINRANMLMENADKNTEISSDVRAQAKAEALFLRSFYYFNLVQGWGDVPFRLEAVKSVEGLSIPRTDKQVIYDRIIADIETAIPDLPSITDLASPGTISQTAAQGILARIYLFRAGEYHRDKKTAGTEVTEYTTKAREWALRVYNSNLHDLAPSYKQVFIDMCSDQYNSQGVYESMWEVEEAGNRINSNAYSAGRIGNTIGFGANVDYSANASFKDYTGMRNPGYGYRFAFASLKLYNMYEEEGDTERGNWNIADYEYTYVDGNSNLGIAGRKYFQGKKPNGPANEIVDGMLYEEEASSGNKTRSAAKYRREYESVTPKNKNFTPINFPILRYSDILLILAETENELNGPADAYQYINRVRNRAGLGDLDAINTPTKADFTDALKKERAMELCFEAIRRWDLIRWGEFYTTMQAMVSYVNSHQGTGVGMGWNTGHKYAADYYNVPASYVYFPIPDWEITTNKAVTQNAGW